MVMGKYSLNIVVTCLNLKIKQILVEDSFFLVHFIFSELIVIGMSTQLITFSCLMAKTIV